jgi:hypothetical protein
MTPTSSSAVLAEPQAPPITFDDIDLTRADAASGLPLSSSLPSLPSDPPSALAKPFLVEPAQQSMRTTALRLAKLGFRVFPLAPGTKDQPLTTHGCKDASSIPDRVLSWWTKCPRANIAIATGGGLVVLDRDTAHDGKPAGDWAKVAEINDGPLPNLHVRTGGGGEHLYLRDDHGLGCSSGDLPPGIDVRGEGGYVVAAGWHRELRTTSTSWEESGETERLPVEHDAMFSLRFPDRPNDTQDAHFSTRNPWNDDDDGHAEKAASLFSFR